MNTTLSGTDLARQNPWHARAVLATFVLTCVCFVGVTLSPLRQQSAGKASADKTDAALYLAEVARMRAGAGYYKAAAAELTARGYPTQSVFNWRTPLPMWLIARLPTDGFGKVILGVLALVLVWAAFEALAREEGDTAERRKPVKKFPSSLRRPLACAVLLSGPLLLCILKDLYVMPVLWAGVLIGLSCCASGLDRRRLGIVLGLAAAFFRELALPYCLLAAAMACHKRRRGEAAAWLVGLLLWGAFFYAHTQQVARFIGPDARAHTSGWLQFGGAPFVISTAQMNGYLLALPQWVTALYLAAALLGLASWDSDLATRVGLTVCLYIILFTLVGHEFNQYWGALIGPLLCFGVVRCPASLRDLWRTSMMVIK